jgi:hypothetical protein
LQCVLHGPAEFRFVVDDEHVLHDRFRQPNRPQQTPKSVAPIRLRRPARAAVGNQLRRGLRAERVRRSAAPRRVDSWPSWIQFEPSGLIKSWR